MNEILPSDAVVVPPRSRPHLHIGLIGARQSYLIALCEAAMHIDAVMLEKDHPHMVLVVRPEPPPLDIDALAKAFERPKAYLNDGDFTPNSKEPFYRGLPKYRKRRKA